MNLPQSTLQSLACLHFPAWFAQAGNLERINALSPEAQQALMRLVIAETNGTPTFDQRERYFNDLSSFDINLNQITSEILSSWLGWDGYTQKREGGVRFFANPPSADEQDNVVSTLMRDGYCLSPLSLTSSQIAQLKTGLSRQTFRTKGLRPDSLNGDELLSCETSGNSAPTDDGDTYWLANMDGLVHDPLFVKLAFDPYIISIASRYLGCPPVHVQTNAWFSFPGRTFKSNLSMNGQLFHQDKEFIKFFKVFIYLSDVGEEQGPHSYIEGSHHDELHRKGVGLSDRVTDADIEKYYDRTRIKSIKGPAGAILFGDTSCVHKGEAVTSGMRIMLQLEYASSLYLSPVPPFSAFSDVPGVLIHYSDMFARRMLSNYSSSLHSIYKKFASVPSAKPSLRVRLRTLVGLIKRRVLS